MYVTMIDIFRTILPKNVTITKVVEKSGKYELSITTEGYSTNVDLNKCVAPGSAWRHCYTALATAMSSLYLSKGNYGLARWWLDQITEKDGVDNFSVAKRDTSTGKVTMLYDYLDSLEDAYLLSQLAMTRKEDWEVVYIYPGPNKSIHRDGELYKRALDLEQKVLECMKDVE